MSSIIAKSKGVYQVRIYLGKVDGKVKHHNKTIHGTLKQARQYIFDYKQKLASGLNPFAQVKTFEELFSRYKAQVFPLLAPNTRNIKESIFRVHLAHAFGSVSITREQARLFVSGLIRKGYAAYTIRGIIRESKALFNFAIDAGILTANPFTRLVLPVKTHKMEITPLKQPEIAKILAHTPKNQDELLVRVALVTGARPSEYIACKWEDFDSANGTLYIKRSAYYERGRGTQTREATKTQGSRRKISLDSATVEFLENLKMRKAANNSDFIFTCSNGRLLTFGQVRHRFNQYLEKVGIRWIRLYWLRHSAATYLLNCGLPVKDVSKRLGHASAHMTLDVYSHALESNEQKAASFFSGKPLLKAV